MRIRQGYVRPQDDQALYSLISLGCMCSSVIHCEQGMSLCGFEGLFSHILPPEVVNMNFTSIELILFHSWSNDLFITLA